MNINSIQYIQNTLKSQGYVLGCKIHYYEELSSTMTIAKNLAIQGSDSGTTVIAKTQISGRGRLDRNWSSPEGGIWMSIVLRPPIAPHDVPLITLASGVSVCTVIQKLFNLSPGLKWPNDVVINGKKVCGILTEGCIDSGTVSYAVLGIGINLNFSADLLPAELRTSATTLLTEIGRPIEPEQFLHQLLIELNSVYRELIDNRPQIIDLWRKFSVTIGKEVSAIYDNKKICGIAKDITQDGNLIIKLGSGEEIEIYSGEVSIRRGAYI